MPAFQILNSLLVAALALDLAAGLAGLLRRDRMSSVLFAGGFALALSSVIFRGIALARPPMQGMSEFFAAMGVLIYPIARLSPGAVRGRLNVIDPLSGALLLFFALFVFDPAPVLLPPGLRHWLFGPHVLAYLAAYLVMFRAAYPALTLLMKREGGRATELDERDLLALIGFGFPFLTAGLVLGAFWGRLAWGASWNWDPKEMWALATWLVYAAALCAPAAPHRHAPRRTAALALLGCVLILCTLMLPNLTRLFSGLHTCGRQLGIGN